MVTSNPPIKFAAENKTSTLWYNIYGEDIATRHVSTEKIPGYLTSLDIKCLRFHRKFNVSNVSNTLDLHASKTISCKASNYGFSGGGESKIKSSAKPFEKEETADPLIYWSTLKWAFILANHWNPQPYITTSILPTVSILIQVSI